MSEPLAVSIGLGLVVSLLFSELFGLAAGGMVVPGYMALFVDKPRALALTVAAAIITFLIGKALGSIVILYGRRRTVIMIVTGYVVGAFLGAILNTAQLSSEGLHIVGYIIPGLLAIWIDRQGMVETVSTMLSASIVVRLTLLLLGMEI